MKFKIEGDDKTFTIEVQHGEFTRTSTVIDQGEGWSYTRTYANEVVDTYLCGKVVGGKTVMFYDAVQKALLHLYMDVVNDAGQAKKFFGQSIIDDAVFSLTRKSVK